MSDVRSLGGALPWHLLSGQSADCRRARLLPRVGRQIGGVALRATSMSNHQPCTDRCVLCMCASVRGHFGSRQKVMPWAKEEVGHALCKRSLDSLELCGRCA